MKYDRRLQKMSQESPVLFKAGMNWPSLFGCAGYLKHLPKKGELDLFSNLLLEYLSCE
jgi:hypothetical protein